MHRLEQQKAASELDKLQQALESKEAQMARVMGGDGQIALLHKHYDQKLSELQCERDELQKERMELLQARATRESACCSQCQNVAARAVWHSHRLQKSGHVASSREKSRHVCCGCCITFGHLCPSLSTKRSGRG